MSEAEHAVGGEERPEREDESDVRLRALLKRALSEEALTKAPPDLLRGVQRRIRRRSKGKFFADGWSTTQTRMNYVLIALVTVLLAVVAYYGLGPTGLR